MTATPEAPPLTQRQHEQLPRTALVRTIILEALRNQPHASHELIK